jgi:Ca2+-binding EF-hand superfamily protein
MDKRELKETFHHYDRDKNGTISLDEFSRLLDALGAHMSDAEKQMGFSIIDSDGNHSIDFAEFVAWWNDR